MLSSLFTKGALSCDFKHYDITMMLGRIPVISDSICSLTTKPGALQRDEGRRWNDTWQEIEWIECTARPQGREDIISQPCSCFFRRFQILSLGRFGHSASSLKKTCPSFGLHYLKVDIVSHQYCTFKVVAFCMISAFCVGSGQCQLEPARLRSNHNPDFGRNLASDPKRNETNAVLKS